MTERGRRPIARLGAARLGCLLAAAALLVDAGPAPGQPTESSSGTTAATVTGGALGLLSGGLLSTAGALIPCSQTRAGPVCVRWAAVAGGAVGLSAGMLIGSARESEVDSRFESAAIGLGAGAALSLAMSPLIHRFGWMDAATVTAFGAAAGGAPRGATIGLGVGAALGFALWRAVPSLELPDFLAVALVGLAIGGLTDWTLGAVDARSDHTGPQMLSFGITF